MRSSLSAYHPSLQALAKHRRSLDYNARTRNPAQEEAPGLHFRGRIRWLERAIEIFELGVVCGLVTLFGLVLTPVLY